MKWFTSDLHFAHPFVSTLRGYALPGYARDESIKQQAERDGRQLKDCVDWRRHDLDIVQAINTYVGKEENVKCVTLVDCDWFDGDVLVCVDVDCGEHFVYPFFC